MQSPVFGEAVDGFIPVFPTHSVPWGTAPPSPTFTPLTQRDIAVLEALKTLFARTLRGVEPTRIDSNVESSLRALGIHKCFGLERDGDGNLLYKTQTPESPCDVPLQLREGVCRDVERLYEKMWGLSDVQQRQAGGW